MKADLKLYARLGVKSGALWLLIVVAGIGFALTFASLALYDAWGAVGGGGPGKTSGMEFIQLYAKQKPLIAITVFGAPFFAIFAILIANKVAMQTILYGLWSNKAVHHVEPAVRSAVARCLGELDGAQAERKLAAFRSGLLNAAKEESLTSKITNRVILHALKRIDLDDIDFQRADFNVGDVVVRKVSEFVAETTEPSLRPFWILLAVQVGVFAGAKFL